MCKFDAEIKSYKDGKTIWIYHNHYLPCTYNSKRCRYVCNCYYYDRAVHISVALDMHTLLDRNNFSSSSNGQVAAHWVTGLIIKRLWRNRRPAKLVHFRRRRRPSELLSEGVRAGVLPGDLRRPGRRHHPEHRHLRRSRQHHHRLHGARPRTQWVVWHDGLTPGSVRPAHCDLGRSCADRTVLRYVILIGCWIGWLRGDGPSKTT